jgi:hypothetical protein
LSISAEDETVIIETLRSILACKIERQNCKDAACRNDMIIKAWRLLRIEVDDGE